MEDLRPKTILFCGLLALAIAVSVLLRARRPVHLLFAGFSSTIALWYTSQSLRDFFRAEVWSRATAILTVLLPQLAVLLFERIATEEQDASKKTPLQRASLVLALPVLLLALSPFQHDAIVRGITYTYVFGLLAAALVSLARRGKRSRSRAMRHRVRFLVVVGALAMTFTLLDFVSFLGVTLPPFSAVISIVFLAVLAESLTRPRMADIYELSARAMVATAIAFSMAGIYYLFFVMIGGFRTMYLNGVLAAIVFLVLFEPLQSAVQSRIHKLFFWERLDLDRSISELRRRLSHVLEIDEMVGLLLAGLDGSRRVTGVALYLPDLDGEGMELAGSNVSAPKHLDSMAVRPLLEKARVSAISLEELEREAESGSSPILAAAEVLGPLRRSVVIGIRGESDDVVIGLLCVADDRIRDAFSPEELFVLEGLAAQVGLVVTNSRVYSRMKERDRLVALGSLAAGLAHEIKNPLGAIKGAAQLLEDDQSSLDDVSREFAGIIVEEVNRLDRVVQSFLDYARPHAGNPVPVDLNVSIRRTIQILTSEPANAEVRIDLSLAESLPRARIDPEKFRQVLLNILQNGIQAMDSRGTLVISTGTRRAKGRALHGLPGEGDECVEVSVRDSGEGISKKVLKNLFVPFFTTKAKGTGLGLAISQSIVQNSGGTIEVQSHMGQGTTFMIVLPVATPEAATALSSETAALSASAAGGRSITPAQTPV